ncbi:MAG: hypothetical protein ACR2PR_11285 [Pseudohongiellaceae bacterium]
MADTKTPVSLANLREAAIEAEAQRAAKFISAFVAASITGENKTASETLGIALMETGAKIYCARAHAISADAEDTYNHLLECAVEKSTKDAQKIIKAAKR